jgi:hypothetical protein
VPWRPVEPELRAPDLRLHPAPAQEIEDRVWAEATALLTDPGRLRDLTDRYLGLAADDSGCVTSELSALDRQIANLRQRMIQGTAQFIKAGADPETVAQAMALLDGS